MRERVWRGHRRKVERSSWRGLQRDLGGKFERLGSDRRMNTGVRVALYR